MKIQLLSDTHFEFEDDGGAEFISTLDPSLCDVLVLAGDIGTLSGVSASISTLCQHYHEKPVIWVLGNHEHYHCSFSETAILARDLVSKNPNLRWLQNDTTTVTVDGKTQRFVGSTLWYADTGNRRWNDFRHIYNLDILLHCTSQACRSFLNSTVEADDVVVTHMLPSTQCVNEKWQGSPNNQFFVNDMDWLISDVQPKLWLHGHGHDASDFMLDKTRIVCNPRGYAHERKAGNGFIPHKIIEI